MTTTGLRSLEVRSLIRPSGELEVSVIESSVPAPGSDEVIVRVEASPVNPSDQGLLYGPADLTSSRRAEVDGKSALVADIPAARLTALRARVGMPLRVGNEGAGTVIAAGQGPAAQALLGKRVAVFAPGMYAQYRCVGADRCFILPSSITTEQGAACFINPLTALGIVETMRLEEHRALVHTAAASNLGLMLARICAEDGIPLVGIVRGPQQAARLATVGNARVLDTSAADFRARLIDAIADCGATIAFDAIGGGGPRRRNPLGDGTGSPEIHQRIPALRITRRQAAVHLRLARSFADNDTQDLRPELCHRRLAPVAVPPANRRPAHA